MGNSAEKLREIYTSLIPGAKANKEAELPRPTQATIPNEVHEGEPIDADPILGTVSSQRRIIHFSRE